MSKYQKRVTVFLLLVVGTISYLYYKQEKEMDQYFAECSRYTIANVQRAYLNRTTTRITYTFRINSQTFSGTSNVGPFDTGEVWFIDREKLKKRRLMIQAYCKDPHAHEILWNVPVPDSLNKIPDEGWSSISRCISK